MNILIVSAHDEGGSAVATLHNAALGVLERAGHKVVVTELYAQQFNPVASKLDFKTNSETHADYVLEQLRAVNTGSGFSPDIEAEMKKVSEAELIIFHFPLWWGSPPAIMQGWFERVLAMGFAWNADARYEKGLMHGKSAFVTTVAGDPLSFFSQDGMHKATVTQHLYSLLHTTLAFCGFDVYQPVIALNLTAASQDEFDQDVSDYRNILKDIESSGSYLYKYSK